jgi:hypothetical protein
MFFAKALPYGCSAERMRILGERHAGRALDSGSWRRSAEMVGKELSKPQSPSQLKGSPK